MKSFIKKTIIVSVIFIFLLAGLISLAYKCIVPILVSNKHIQQIVVNTIKKQCDADLILEDIKMQTQWNWDIQFELGKINLRKNNKEFLNLCNIDCELSLSEILSKNLIIKKFIANNIYVNASELINLFPQEQEKKKQPQAQFSFDIYSALISAKKCVISYDNADFSVLFDANNIEFDRTQATKYLHFDFDYTMSKGQDKIFVAANDKNRIYMQCGELHIDKLPIEINKSKIFVDAFASKKQGYYLTVSSKKFNAKDIYNILTSNILLQNGKELLKPICDVQGNVDFRIKLSKNNIDGHIKIDNSDFCIVDLLNMPVKVLSGEINIDNKNIVLKDFKGFYNGKKNNNWTMHGTIKDYIKTCDTEIVSDIFVNDDFFKNYVTKMLGAPIGMIGDAGSRLTLTSKNGSCDILWYFLLKENEGFTLGDESMVLKNYKTLFKVDLSIIENILKINTINYYITNELKKGMTPLLAINGNMDMADNMKLLDINMNIPKPLPSEFLNFLTCQKIFKNGTVSGNLRIDNRGEFPQMAGVISLDNVRIPSQRLYIKSAKIGARDDKLGAIAEGRFKRSNYKFNGYIVNDLRLPIIVKNINLTIDDIDIEKMLAINTSNAQIDIDAKDVLNSDRQIQDNDDIPTFTKGLVIVEKCALNLIKGIYKDIHFGNIHANLTLDKDGILNVQSNKFDIAGGISTLKVNADLINNQYYLRLGIKDVNSDVMASSILGLPREISGKAKGLIELHANSNLKLNGDIKFNITDGTIEKIGYIEYLLKVASLFRNPLAMISPTTLGDLVNIPNGKFDDISGEIHIKDNVILPMKIKSSASELATFIVGKYNLETNDASLRIYTKFSNKDTGFAGFLRNISLNTLAQKLSKSGRNDSNYYISELEQIPELKVGEDKAQIFLTRVDGDIVNFNFLSSLKRIK